MNTVSKNRFHGFPLYTARPVRGPQKGDFMRPMRPIEPVVQEGRIPLLEFVHRDDSISQLAGSHRDHL